LAFGPQSFGEWRVSPVDSPKLRSLAKALLKKGIPPVKGLRDKELCHLVFVPEVAQPAPSEIDGVHVVTGDQVLSVVEIVLSRAGLEDLVPGFGPGKFVAELSHKE